MGALGSSRWKYHNAKPLTCETIGIDVRFLRKRGMLEPGRVYPLSWSSRLWGKQIGSIVYACLKDRLILSYCYRGEGIEQTVSLDRTPCHYGGTRPWLLCECGRRVAVLYGAGKLFKCRHCYGLAFDTQREDPIGRCRVKAQKIREKLGGSPSLFDAFPQKPKGMHWRTYERLHYTARIRSAVSMGALVRRFEAQEANGERIYQEWKLREARRKKREAALLEKTKAKVKRITR